MATEFEIKLRAKSVEQLGGNSARRAGREIGAGEAARNSHAHDVF